MYLSCFGMILSCFDMVLQLHVGKWFAAGVFLCSASFAQNPKRTDRTRHHVGMFSGMLLRMFALLGCLELAAAAPFGVSCFHDFSLNGYGRTDFCRRVHPYSRGRGLGAEYRSTELTPLSGGSGERRSAEPSNPGFFATIRFWACSSERGSKAACSFESGCSGSFGSECACSFGSECACSFGSGCACSFGSGCDCSFDSGCYGCSSGPCFSSGDGGFRFLGAAVARGWPILKEVQGFPWNSSARHTIQRCCWFDGAGSDGSQLKCWGAVADHIWEKGVIGARSKIRQKTIQKQPLREREKNSCMFVLKIAQFRSKAASSIQAEKIAQFRSKAASSIQSEKSLHVRAENRTISLQSSLFDPERKTAACSRLKTRSISLQSSLFDPERKKTAACSRLKNRSISLQSSLFDPERKNSSCSRVKIAEFRSKAASSIQRETTAACSKLKFAQFPSKTTSSIQREITAACSKPKIRSTSL